MDDKELPPIGPPPEEPPHTDHAGDLPEAPPPPEPETLPEVTLEDLPELFHTEPRVGQDPGQEFRRPGDVKKQIEDHLRNEAEKLVVSSSPESQKFYLDHLKKGISQRLSIETGRPADEETVEREANRIMQEQHRGYGYPPEVRKRIIEAASKGEAQAWEVIDEMLADIYDTADMKIAEPFQLDFDASIKEREIFEMVKEIEMKKGVKLAQKTSLMGALRRTTHNALWMLESGQGKPDKMSEYMQMSAELLDLLFNIKGVAPAYRFYEKVLRQMQARGDNFIDPEKLSFRVSHDKSNGVGQNQWDEEVFKVFYDALERGAVDGTDYTKPENQAKFEIAWPDWKIRRALSMGKAFGGISLRFPQAIAMTELKRNLLMTSPKYEHFVRPLNPLGQLVRKFGFGPAVELLYFYLTKEKKFFKGWKDTLDAFADLTEDPTNKDAPSYANFYDYNGPTSSTWRTTLMTNTETYGNHEQENWMSPELKKNRKALGLQFHLSWIENQLSEYGIGPEPDKKKGKAVHDIWSAKKLALETERFEALQSACLRSPLLVLRLLTDKDENGRAFQKYQKIINSMTFGSENIPVEKLDRVEHELSILQEKAVHDKALGLDYSLIPDEQLREEVKKYAQSIEYLVMDPKSMITITEKGKQKKITLAEAILDPALMNKRSPYSLEMSDADFEATEFAKTGQMGWLGRAWTDYKDLYDANNGLAAFLDGISTATDAKAIAQLIKPISHALGDIHRINALQVTEKLVDGVIMASSKEFPYAPWPYELIKKAKEEPESYMQRLFGRNSIAWNKIEQRNFVKHMRFQNMIEGKQSTSFYDRFHLHRKYTISEAIIKYGTMALFIWLIGVAKHLADTLKEESKDS